MFLILLSGTLLFGWGLFVTASYSDGQLITSRSAALAIGWLLACASFVALRGLRQASWEKIGAAAVTFFCSAALLYLSYFEWGETPPAPLPVAAAAMLNRADHEIAAASVSVTAPLPKAPPKAKQLVTAPAAPAALAEACFALEGIEFLQCNRCADTTGLRRVACHERARLEYCESRPADSQNCTSAIPYLPPA